MTSLYDMRNQLDEKSIFIVADKLLFQWARNCRKHKEYQSKGNNKVRGILFHLNLLRTDEDIDKIDRIKISSLLVGQAN